MKKKLEIIEIVSNSQNDINKILETLLFIKKKSKDNWRQIKLITAIIVSPKNGYDNQLFPKERIWICQAGTVRKSSIPYLASLLMHEACHIGQYRMENKKWTESLEKQAYQVQRNFLAKYGTLKEVDWLDKMFKKRWWLDNFKIYKTSSLKKNYFRKILNKYKKRLDPERVA